MPDVPSGNKQANSPLVSVMHLLVSAMPLLTRGLALAVVISLISAPIKGVTPSDAVVLPQITARLVCAVQSARPCMGVPVGIGAPEDGGAESLELLQPVSINEEKMNPNSILMLI